MPEILMILVIALIIFGPRKLPELGRSIGQSLAQFRRASEDFKRQWEEEVDLEQRRLNSPAAPVEPAGNISPYNYETGEAETGEAAQEATGHQDVGTPASSSADDEQPYVAAPREQTVPRETKRDWM
jgi:TatA/E family protein of Tat protein translocase